MNNRMYLGGSVMAIIMALGYYIAPAESVGYVVMGTFGLVGLFSRLTNHMSIARMGMELGLLVLLTLLTPEDMVPILSYFGTTYVVAAYIGAIINASYRSYIIKRDAVAMMRI